MKIVIINGSARKGNTLTAINAFIKGASEKNEIEIIEPDKLNIAPCRGCGVCQCSKGCVDKDDTNSTIDKIAAADMILFATPVYWWGMSAQLKDVYKRQVLLFRTRMKQSSHKTVGRMCSEPFIAVPVVLCAIRPNTTTSSKESFAAQIVAEQCWSKLKPAANAITFWIRHFIVAALIGSMVRKPAPLTTWKPVFCMKLSLLTFRHTQRPLWATETPLCEKLQTRCTFGYLLTGRSTSGN